jgi:hypothetical protein
VRPTPAAMSFRKSQTLENMTPPGMAATASSRRAVPLSAPRASRARRSLSSRIDPRSTADIVARVATLRGEVESEAIGFDPLDLGKRNRYIGGRGNSFVQAQQVVSRLRGKGDLAPPRAPSLSLAA